MKKFSADDVCLWLKENRPDVELVEYGGGVIQKSTFRCKKDGNVWQASFQRLKHGVGCPVCGVLNCTTHRFLNTDVVRVWLEKYKPNIEILEYGGSVVKKSKFRCKVCGYTWITTLNSVRCGHGCPKCVHKARITEDEVKQWLEQNRPHIELVKYGGNVVKKSKFRCTKDGYEWGATFSHLKQGSGCPKCAGKARVTEDDAREWLKKHTPDIELVEYGGSVTTSSKFRCKKCGSEWSARFCLQMQKGGTGCRQCTKQNKNNAVAQDMRDYLSANYPDVELVEYGGTTMALSTFRCKKCGWEWKRSVATVKRTKSDDICPKCGKYKTVGRVKKESECNTNE